MKRYKIFREGICTNQWLDSDLPANHYEPNFGKPERWLSPQKDKDGVEYVSGEDISQVIASRESEPDPQGNVVKEYLFAAEYTIVEEDMTAELAAAEADKKDRDEVKKHLKGLKKADLKTVEGCADAILKILKHLRADK